MSMVPRCVLVERPSEYQQLLARHGTREQAAFFLSQRGGQIEPVEQRHQQQRGHHAGAMAAVPAQWRRAAISREDLDRFLFEPEDIIVVLGQDGLVANVAKYLEGQPVIGLNPHPDIYPGNLVTHDPAAIGDLFADLISGHATLEHRTMVKAELDDGQQLVALNEIFVGHASHQSARYQITLGEMTERQSSSGLIVATGTGATGWAASLHLERHSTIQLPTPDEGRLVFFVREPWPSIATGTTLTEGELLNNARLEITSELTENAVLFGDGIEADRLHLDWGQHLRIGLADRHLTLVS
jgi:NAD kinase